MRSGGGDNNGGGNAEDQQAFSKVGTPLYMSPEVLRGGGYSWSSDVWSLGCVLYELAMLRSPFKSEGLNLYSLFQKISSVRKGVDSGRLQNSRIRLNKQSDSIVSKYTERVLLLLATLVKGERRETALGEPQSPLPIQMHARHFYFSFKPLIACIVSERITRLFPPPS